MTTTLLLVTLGRLVDGGILPSSSMLQTNSHVELDTILTTTDSIVTLLVLYSSS